MAITGIGTLTEFGLNQTPAQPLQQTPQAGEQKAADLAIATTPNDQFVPSAQNGQQQDTAEAAGLFTVAQLTPFTAAAGALLAAAPGVLINRETAALNVNPATGVLGNGLFAQPAALQTDAAAPAVTVAPNDIAGAQAAGLAADQANAALVGNAAPPVPNANVAAPNAQTGAPTNAIATAEAPAPATANTAATGTASVTEQLQALNDTLEALGLSAADLQQIDQIASVIKDFNPAAFTSLAYQLAALAPPSAAQLAPANATTTPNAAHSTAGR
jgi:hypothetical protein